MSVKQLKHATISPLFESCIQDDLKITFISARLNFRVLSLKIYNLLVNNSNKVLAIL